LSTTGAPAVVVIFSEAIDLSFGGDGATSENGRQSHAETSNLENDCSNRLFRLW
jgi:hypothetical protein